MDWPRKETFEIFVISLICWKVLPEKSIAADTLMFPKAIPFSKDWERQVKRCLFLQSKSTMIIVPLMIFFSIEAGEQQIVHLCKSWVKQDQNTRNIVPSEIDLLEDSGTSASESDSFSLPSSNHSLFKNDKHF